MERELEITLSDFGLPLMLVEISKEYDLAMHIQTSDYYSINERFCSKLNFFLMQNIQSQKRNLLIEFISHCEKRGYGHTLGRVPNYSWRPSFESHESSSAIFLKEEKEWSEEFILPSLPEGSPYLEKQIFYEKAINLQNKKDCEQKFRRIVLLDRVYYGEKNVFQKELADSVEKYRDMMGKGKEVRTIRWSDRGNLEVRR